VVVRCRTYRFPILFSSGYSCIHLICFPSFVQVHLKHNSLTAFSGDSGFGDILHVMDRGTERLIEFKLATIFSFFNFD
jgi:hypothetical protein